jgi:CRISPR system Cascade subunit CasB
MTEKSDWRTDFTTRLLELANPAHPDRATLAELRRCLRGDPARALIRVGWLFSRIKGQAAVDDAVVVAALFALNQGICEGVSLGDAFRRLRDATGSDSVEKRFTALLDSEREDLPARLRHAVSLLKAHEIGLDWRRLLTDLGAWDNDARWVQRRWARDFWAEQHTEAPGEPTNTATEATPV